MRGRLRKGGRLGRGWSLDCGCGRSVEVRGENPRAKTGIVLSVFGHGIISHFC